jgi:hypothetical protein
MYVRHAVGHLAARPPKEVNAVRPIVPIALVAMASIALHADGGADPPNLLSNGNFSTGWTTAGSVTHQSTGGPMGD